MGSNVDQILKDALTLSPAERAGLVDRIISSLDTPDESIDRVWRKEIAKRIDAYRAGNIETVSAEEVLESYRKQ